jgi:hypothetical protein
MGNVEAEFGSRGRQLLKVTVAGVVIVLFAMGLGVVVAPS